MSVIGTTLLVLDRQPYHSPSFPRGGLAATFAVKVSQFVGITTFEIEVEHRDEHDTNFTSAGAFASITGDGPFDVDLGGLKQIVRFRYSFTGGSSSDGVHFIMQAPSWRPYD